MGVCASQIVTDRGTLYVGFSTNDDRFCSPPFGDVDAFAAYMAASPVFSNPGDTIEGWRSSAMETTRRYDVRSATRTRSLAMIGNLTRGCTLNEEEMCALDSFVEFLECLVAMRDAPDQDRQRLVAIMKNIGVSGYSGIEDVMSDEEFEDARCRVFLSAAQRRRFTGTSVRDMIPTDPSTSNQNKLIGGYLSGLIGVAKITGDRPWSIASAIEAFRSGRTQRWKLSWPHGRKEIVEGASFLEACGQFRLMSLDGFSIQRIEPKKLTRTEFMLAAERNHIDEMRSLFRSIEGLSVETDAQGNLQPRVIEDLREIFRKGVHVAYASENLCAAANLKRMLDFLAEYEP